METLASILQAILPHWPFFTAMVIFTITGQVAKEAVFPKRGWLTRKPVWLFYWGRKTLPLHPILLGAGLGLVWRNPDPLTTNLPASMAYFAFAGALSVWCFEVVKALLKKEGIDLEIPGVTDTTVPPPPPGSK